MRMWPPPSRFGAVMTWLEQGDHNELERHQLRVLAHVLEPADGALGALLWRAGPGEVLRTITHGSRYQGLNARLAALGDQDPKDVAASAGARIITKLDGEWPGQLDDLQNERPFALWVHGAADLRMMALHSVAFVGARAATSYGEEVCRQWVSRCCDAGITIVSGGAYGIDGTAHRAALSAQGMTIAVLASGVDVAYPQGHAALLASIADQGLLVSESPPGSTVRRQRFLTRNRLIAALSRATVVVEAALRSGTTATANAATALCRPVLAVPGPVTSAMSAGCHHLIAERQADVAATCTDILNAVGGLQPGVVVGMRRPWDNLDPKAAQVLDAVPAHQPIDLVTLMKETGLALPEVLAGAGPLLARGLLIQNSDGFQRALGPASHALAEHTAP